MTAFEVDPLKDPRWASFVAEHPRSSVFHTAHWLEALTRTYNYKARVFTSDPPDTPLKNSIVLCEVNSWLTGSRLVSLPFSDHCDPLLSDSTGLSVLLQSISQCAAGLKFAEIRPRSEQIMSESGFHPHDEFFLHTVDLTRSLDQIYSKLHKDGV
jgi:hypothetical protein